jgi:dihydroflavonol-4-reductase
MVENARRLRVSPGGVCIAHVDDVAGGIVSAMEHGAPGGRYILGGDNLTYREWMTKMADALGVQPHGRVVLPAAAEPAAAGRRG